MPDQAQSLNKGLVEEIKSHLHSQEFLERNRKRPQDFTRQRILTFTLLILFLINFVKRALQDELDEYFKVLSGNELALRAVSKSAFTIARRKIKHEAFIELNQVQVDYFYQHYPLLDFHGFRLLAIDGSMSDLPDDNKKNEIGKHFGYWGSRHGTQTPKARISQMFDVLNEVTVDAIIAPKEQGERVLAAEHLKAVGAGDLVLLDRGYPAFWLFVVMMQQGAAYCARISGWNVVDEFIKSGLPEAIVTLNPSHEAKKECHNRDLPIDPIQVRLIRVELEDEVEVLVTNLLDSEAYPHHIFKDLYNNRWPVEEDYKNLKSKLQVENWSGKTVHSVYQDFHAKVFSKNLTGILAHQAQEEVLKQSASKKHDYQVNMSQAFSKMKDTIVLLFQKPSIGHILQWLWMMMTKTVEPIRKGRSYERKKRVKRKRFPSNYKPLR